jgi:hypothetical protein
LAVVKKMVVMCSQSDKLFDSTACLLLAAVELQPTFSCRPLKMSSCMQWKKSAYADILKKQSDKKEHKERIRLVKRHMLHSCLKRMLAILKLTFFKIETIIK